MRPLVCLISGAFLQLCSKSRFSAVLSSLIPTLRGTGKIDCEATGSSVNHFLNRMFAVSFPSTSEWPKTHIDLTLLSFYQRRVQDWDGVV